MKRDIGGSTWEWPTFVMSSHANVSSKLNFGVDTSYLASYKYSLYDIFKLSTYDAFIPVKCHVLLPLSFSIH